MIAFLPGLAVTNFMPACTLAGCKMTSFAATGCFGQGHVIQAFLIGLAPVDRNLFHLGEDHQCIGIDLLGRQLSSKVLVDNICNFFQRTVLILCHGNAATAAGNDNSFLTQALFPGCKKG